MLREEIGNTIEVLLISETFPSAQFLLDGFTPPYRLDRVQHGGNLMLLIWEEIPSKLLSADTSLSRI